MSRARELGKRLLRGLLAAAASLALTLGFFLVLPVFQSIAQPTETDLLVRALQTSELQPPPPPAPEEPEDEPEPEEEPPELVEQAAPLDLAQLELALDRGLSAGWTGGDLAVKLESLAAAAGGTRDVEALFAVADLDQKPRVLHQPSPVLDAAARRRTPGSVMVLFVVDPRGRVESPIVQESSDPALEAPALAAVRQWRFEPGRKNGQPVRFRMRVPITFPKG
jgi:protein TonB